MENEYDRNVSSKTYCLPTGEVKSKILEFAQFFNSSGRLSLLHCSKSESEELIHLLLTLKKDIKYGLSELGRSHNVENYEYTCPKCTETITINPQEDFWTCLQNHTHFEEMYVQFLNGSLKTNDPTDTSNVASTQTAFYVNHNASTSYFDCANENTDSGIDNEPGEGQETSNSDKQENTDDEGVNTFRFNFAPHYPDVIEKKIYPTGLMKTVQKIDKVSVHTIQKNRRSKAFCLLCSCDLVGKNKLSRFNIEDHVMGQRHLRHASAPENVEGLKRYHELWLNFEVPEQAHQVYFKPLSSTSVKCNLCNASVNHDEVLSHINDQIHQMKVVDSFERKNSSYLLLEQQLELYEIKPAKVKEVTPVAPKVPKEIKYVPKNKVRVQKTDSDSSPCSESQEPKHVVIKSVENPTSDNISDLIPNRFKPHLKYLKNNGDNVTCNLCNVTVPKDVLLLKKHLKSSSHFKASDVTLQKYKYYCEICNEKFFEEGPWDNHHLAGPNKHADMAESRKAKATEYECIKCSTVIFGDEISLTRHLSLNMRDRRSKVPKLSQATVKLFRTREVLEQEAEKLITEANNVVKVDELTVECCNRLEATLRSVFEACKVYPFGSRISGLGEQNSDLDVFVDTGDMYDGTRNQDPFSQIQLVRKTYAIFTRHKDEFQDMFQIPTARTPIVRLFHKPTKIDCDLSFKHGLSVENTKFVKFCLSLQPIVQPFILVLKKWSQQNNFTEHISTYAFTLMAVFYMQINNYLLSVKKVRELNPERSLVINGWQTIKYTVPLEVMKTYVKPYPNGILVLLKDFFRFYANFKYSEDVICPLLGHIIKKKQFADLSLPEEMNSYVDQLQKEDKEEFRLLSPICIQDPFDLSHNLTKACQASTLNKFKTLCNLSAKHLDSLG